MEAADWKENFRNGISSLKKICQDAEIQAVSVSGNGPTLVPVRRSGEALQPLYWFDGRVYTPPDLPEKPASFFLPHAAWLKHHAEHQYDDVQCFLSAQEWLSYQLGAEPVTVLPSASYVPYYWDDNQCGMFHLDTAKFPPFAELGSGIGKVSSRAASYFDLAPGTPIIAGGPDYIMALIGTGTIKNGIVCDRAGTSEGINVCTGSPVFIPELRTLPHVKEGLWNVNAMIPRSGRLFEWFRDSTGQSGRPYEEMMEEIIADQGFDCRSGGEEWSSVLENLHTRHSPAVIASPARIGRAVVEFIGFMVFDALRLLKDKGFPVTEMRLSGGQGKSPLWNQLKADISGCTLLVPEIIDAELAGNACIALVQLGEAANIDEACQKIVRIKETYASNPEYHRQYLDCFASYKNVKSRMETLFP